MSYRRVFLADLSSTTPPTPLQRRHSGGLGVSERVHVQGLCVSREEAGAQRLCIEIDDGTSVALLQARGEAVAAELQEVAPGKMVRAMGDVQDAPLFVFGRSWRQWIDAASVCVVENPNAESLHVLETLLLHKDVYLKEAPAPPRGGEPSSIPLLPFPRYDVPTEKDATPQLQPGVGTKRKLMAPVEQPPPPTPSPLKPSLLEMNATQQQERGAHAFSAASASSVPPAEYQFHVSGAALKLIGSGAKTLEMRLNNPPYSIIRANDRLKFNGKIVTTVRAVRKYAQLRTALEMETLSSLLPPATPGAPGVSLNGAVRLLRQFISEAEEARHGVAVFEFQVPPGASTALRTPGEWSKLIYEFVGTKGSVGCSLRDLQFAFPALAVQTIEAMLTDLQMDAVVYFSKGTYRLI